MDEEPKIDDESTVEVPDEPRNEPETRKVPSYLGDKEPTDSIVNYVKWSLLHGKTEEELINAGVNASTVRGYAKQLEDDGLWTKPPKIERRLMEKPQAQPKERINPDKARVSVVTAPETILSGMQIPDGIEGLEQFEKGIKFGASMVMLGVRIAQELAMTGVQQAKPLIDMAKDMRQGEAFAAEHASSTAAQEAAERVANDILPHLAELRQPSREIEPIDPMKKMMADLMKPVLQQMVANMVPGLKLPVASANPDETADADLPAGWTQE